MATCPVCNVFSNKKINNTPYWDCGYCGCYWQEPLPPKVYEADHEKDEHGGFKGHLMSDLEKDCNRWVAGLVFYSPVGLNSTPGKVLDIGAKYPYLSYCLKELGCEAYAMDNIEIVPEYSKELNIPMLMADFEAITDEQIQEWTKSEKFQAITMVHCFEHMEHPIEALRKIRRLLADDGCLFLRLPQHDISGYERDLTPGHFTIHPFFHSLSSILELLVQTKDLFTVAWESPMEGSGQRDILLKPIVKKPVVWAGMIVKNEERDLPICLNSIKGVVDGIVIIDTGSTDNTASEAAKTWFSTNKPMIYETYTDASKQDDSGDWKLFDFGKARNQFVERIEAMPEVDYLIWFDADDTLMTANNLRKAFYLSNWDVFGVQIESGGLMWTHHRAWKTKKGVHFAGKIHEYPVIGDNNTFILEDTIIHHDAAPGIGETSNERNLRILLQELEENPNDLRTLFYLANTHKDASRFKESLPYYAARIKEVGYWDEQMFAYLYKARCERAAELLDEAKKTLLEACSKAPDWAEFWAELMYMEYDTQNYEKSIGYGLIAANCKNIPTQLWREPNKYGDQPRRMISFAYTALGRADEALYWAIEAKKHIGSEDVSWDERIKYLQASVRKEENRNKKIALVRPGAVGDVLMICNSIPELRKKYPEATIDFFTKVHELTPILVQAGINNVYDSDTLPVLESTYDQVKYLIGYPIESEGYPDKPMSLHLLEYFYSEVMA